MFYVEWLYVNIILDLRSNSGKQAIRTFGLKVLKYLYGNHSNSTVVIVDAIGTKESLLMCP